MTILDIRGTHGSGKSWIVHKLIELDGSLGYVVDEDQQTTLGMFLPGWSLAILGTYDRVCGGCDGIKTADEIVRRAKLFAKEYKNVLLEGILVAHTYRRYAAMAKDTQITYPHQRYVFCFLDTPYDVCIQRVEARRVARGQPAEFDHFHLTTDFDRCHRKLPVRLRNEGFNVEILDWQDPMPKVLELLRLP